MRWSRSTHYPNSSVRSPRICDKRVVQVNDKLSDCKLLSADPYTPWGHLVIRANIYLRVIRVNDFKWKHTSTTTNLKASTSRRWHFCLLMMQKPAHPVGSSRSRGPRHIGTCSSTRATHTSLSRQSSQYLVALVVFRLVASASASPVGEEALPGNDGSPLKRALMVNASVLTVADVGPIPVVTIVKFSSPFDNVEAIGSPDVTFCPVNLPADDLRYCWMIWSFSGSVKKKKAISHLTLEKLITVCSVRRNGCTDLIYRLRFFAGEASRALQTHCLSLTSKSATVKNNKNAKLKSCNKTSRRIISNLSRENNA